jgi:hypothetical protein
MQFEPEIDPKAERRERLRKYQKDLILPEGGLPYDLLTAVH